MIATTFWRDWAYSILVYPIYLVGRYDIVALPAFCMLTGWGISRWVKTASPFPNRLRSGIIIILLGLLWTTTLFPYYEGLKKSALFAQQYSGIFFGR